MFKGTDYLDVISDREEGMAWDHQDVWPGAPFDEPREGADYEGGNALHVEPLPIPADPPTKDVAVEEGST